MGCTDIKKLPRGGAAMGKKQRFLEFLERLVRVTHNPDFFDRETYVELIHDICECYGLSKGDVEFYRNASAEQKHEGSYFCDFDNGHAHKIINRIRLISKTQAVLIATLYADESAEFSDEEIDQLGVMLRVILSFVSRRRMMDTLETFGFTDEKGYPNFRAFARYLEMRNAEGKLAGNLAVHMDLHNFTLVNQEVGRECADQVMWNYFEAVKRAVGEKGIVSRLGGDKFIAVLPPEVKERFFEVLNGIPVPYDEESAKRIFVSAAAGIYAIPESFVMHTSGDIMDKITLSCGVAKRSDEGNIVFYDENMRSMREMTKLVQRDFRIGLKKEEFLVYYQPKVDVNTGEIVGAEALCRWFRDGSIVPPMNFIPVLEQNMDICDLDFYMLDHVCRDIRRWLDVGRNVVRVSVNLSRKHLVDVDLLDHIMTVIDKYHVPHEYIEIELTETTTDVQFRDLKRVVSGLRELGVHAAVDDFGIGYSSLNLIREIPWDVLKVDKCFLPMDDENDNSINNVMFKHVVALAQDMGLECVVEGVETEKQLEILRTNCCNIAQGFYFDRPLPVEKFERRMVKKGYETPDITGNP